MAIGAIVSKIFAGKATDLVKTAGDLIDNFTLSKEEKEQFKIQMMQEANKMALAMAQEDNKELELLVNENKSARDREMQIATSEKANWITRNTTAVLALGFVGVTLALYVLSVLKTVEIHQDILQDLRDIVILIMGYYFGSSLGSHAKQKQIEKMQSNAGN